ncbi:hypothetical protein FRB99_008535 [Tulasnella sp. 403]|nr:hypothetical protein FRB99_008535 [Tulasnella sp. 403]
MFQVSRNDNVLQRCCTDISEIKERLGIHQKPQPRPTPATDNHKRTQDGAYIIKTLTQAIDAAIAGDLKKSSSLLESIQGNESLILHRKPLYLNIANKSRTSPGKPDAPSIISNDLSGAIRVSAEKDSRVDDLQGELITTKVAIEQMVEGKYTPDEWRATVATEEPTLNIASNLVFGDNVIALGAKLADSERKVVTADKEVSCDIQPEPAPIVQFHAPQAVHPPLINILDDGSKPPPPDNTDTAKPEATGDSGGAPSDSLAAPEDTERLLHTPSPGVSHIQLPVVPPRRRSATTSSSYYPPPLSPDPFMTDHSISQRTFVLPDGKGKIVRFEADYVSQHEFGRYRPRVRRRGWTVLEDLDTSNIPGSWPDGMTTAVLTYDE